MATITYDIGLATSPDVFVNDPDPGDFIDYVEDTALTAYTPSAQPDSRVYFGVRQHQGAGVSGWSIRDLSILQLPIAPTLVSPANNAYVDDTTPTFDWDEDSTASTSNAATSTGESSVGTSGGVRYTTLQSFQVGSTGRIRQLGFYLGSNTGSPVGNLRWNVYADSGGAPGALLATGVFVPVASSLNTVAVDAFISLTSATSYWLELAPVSVQANGNQWSWSHSTNAYGSGTYGVTADGVFSPNAAIDSRFSLTVLVGSNPQVDTWELQLATDSGFTTGVELISGLTTSTYTWLTPLADNDYYWRVRGRNASGAGAWSSTRTLNVQQLPDVPALTFPDDERFIQDFRLETVGFNWGDVSGADNYWIQISTISGDYSSPVIDDATLTVSAYAPGAGVLTPDIYYWRVAAGNETGWSAWSSEREFVVTDPVDVWMAALSGFRIAWFAKDADALLMRAINPYVAEGRHLLTGNNSTMSGANSWVGTSLGTFDINSTVAGKAYALGNGGSDLMQLSGTAMAIGKAYKISLKARLNSGASTAIRFGTDFSISSANFLFTPTATETVFSGIIIATGAQLNLGLSAGFNGVAFEFDDITIQQVNIRPSTDFPPSTGRLNIAINSDMGMDYAFSGTNWAWSSGGYVHTPGSTTALSQTLAPTLIGKSYNYEVVVSGQTTGDITVGIGTTGTGSAHSGNGTFTGTAITAAGTIGIYITPSSAFDGKIESLVVTPNDDLLLMNGDGGSTTGWTAENSVTHTSTAGKHRLTYGGNATPQIRQSVLTVGRRYRASGSANGDGTAVWALRCGTTTLLTGTSSATPAAFDIEFTASATEFRPRGQGMGAANFVEFDNLVVVEVNPMDGVISGAALNASAPAAFQGDSLVFDGSNDFVNVYSAELNSVIADLTEMTAIAAVQYSGSWTDGTSRRMAFLAVDSNNRSIDLYKHTADNEVRATQIGASTSKTVSWTPQTIGSNWTQVAQKLTDSGDALELNVNGIDVGTPQTGIVATVGNIAAANAVLGASTSSGANPWSGEIACLALFDGVISDDNLEASAQLLEVI